VATPLRLLALSVYSAGDAAGSVPQSLTPIVTADGQQRLLVGLRNGRIVNYCVSSTVSTAGTSGNGTAAAGPERVPALSDVTVRRLAESPVAFVEILSPFGPALVGLLQDRTLLVQPSRWSLGVQRVCLQGAVASHVAPFCCAACPFGLAVIVDTELRIVSLDHSQRLDVSTLPLCPLPHCALTGTHAHRSSAGAEAAAEEALGRTGEGGHAGGAVGIGGEGGGEDLGRAGVIGARDDFMASRVVWVPGSRCVLVACNYYGATAYGMQGAGGQVCGTLTRLLQ
jgi:hypothetical protein